MRLRDGLATMYGGGPRRSAWNVFPWAIVAAMSLVVVVNAGMVYYALDTFPGQTSDGGFDLSNHYNQVLEVAQRHAALGWTVQVVADGAGRAVVALTDRAGAPLQGARVNATAERPLGAPHATRLLFHDAGAGRYVADAALSMPGQWELEVSAAANGHAVTVTRRIVVKPHPQQRTGARPGPDTGSPSGTG
jgi:nitrogen fixation protein FixH